MTSTYLQIQQRVQSNVIDLPTAVQTAIPVLVNQAQRFLMRMHNFRVMLAEKQFITTVGTHVIGQIPSDWKEERGDPYYVLQLGGTREMVWDKERLYSYRQWDPFDPNSKGSPRELLIGESVNDTVPDPSNPDQNASNLNIEVYPYPDGVSDWTTAPAGEYRIRVPYWRFLPDLAANGDTNWFTTFADEFLEEFATARAFMRNWDEARAQQWMVQAVGGKFDGSEERTLGGWARVAINVDAGQRAAPSRVLTARRDVFAPRDQWRT